MVKDLRKQERIINIRITATGFKFPLDEVLDMYVMPEIERILKEHIPTGGGLLDEDQIEVTIQ